MFVVGFVLCDACISVSNSVCRFCMDDCDTTKLLCVPVMSHT